MATTQKPPTQQTKSSSSSVSGGSSRVETSNNNVTKPSNTRDTDKLKRAWRSLASSVVVSTRAAEKVTDITTIPKELDDSILTLLRARGDFRKYVTVIEANLLGQAKENEAMEGLLRSQPTMGRKRRRVTNSIITSDSPSAGNGDSSAKRN